MILLDRPRKSGEGGSVKIREAAQAGAQIICLQELFRSQYFCREERRRRCFDLAEPIPGDLHRTLAASSRREHRVVDRGVAVRARAQRAVSQHRRHHRRRRAIAGHLPQDAHPGRSALLTRSTISRPAISASRTSTRSTAASASLVCWDQWYPEGARLTRCRARTFSSIPTAIGWHPAEKAQYGAAQHDAWRTIQRAHAIANGVYVAAVESRRASKDRPTDDGLEFWGISFVCRSVRPGDRGSLARQGRDPDRRVRSGAAMEKSAATGPSSATAASTPTAASRSRWLD